MSPTTDTSVRRASIELGNDPEAAVRRFVDQLQPTEAALACVFFDREAATAETRDALRQHFADTPTLACSTAGEIYGTIGYTEGSLTGFSLAKDSGVQAQVAHLEDLEQFTTESAEQLVRDLRQGLGDHDAAQCFALLVIDGLSLQEERITYALQSALGSTPLLGGSAGDGLRFGGTEVLAMDGSTAGASLALVSCARPFKVLRTQHFVATDTKMVVTAAEPERRRVMELNGMPAADEYAATLGLDVSELDPSVFARNPLLVRIAGNMHVRSIQRAEPDGSLYIYCAIDEGLVMTLGQGQSIVENLESCLQGAVDEIGEPQLVLGFDCILRRLESDAFGLDADLQKVFERFQVVGFNTYGEQCGAVHVNQTFTGVALGGSS